MVIADASIHPQGYAAFINYDGDIRGSTVLADIGNGTMSVAFMQNGKPLAGKIFTEQLLRKYSAKELRIFPNGTYRQFQKWQRIM